MTKFYYLRARRAYRLASAVPCETFTVERTGTAAHTMMTKKKKAYRMFPVQSDINPTISGPKNEDDCQVPSQINDVTEYRAHAQHTLSVIENRPYL
jgi:hypothetical protein